MPLLQYLEFPWRALSLVAASTALLCGAPFLLLAPGKERLAKGLMVVLIAALFLSGFSRARPEAYLEVEDADYSPQAIAAQDIAVTTAREYEPIWVRERPPAPATEPFTLLAGEGRVLGARLSPTYGDAKHRYEFHAQVAELVPMEEARLRINTFYFPGWTLYVDGARRPIDYDNPQGVMTLSLERGEHLVQVLFADTPVRLWSERLSLLALLLLLATPWLRNFFPSPRPAPSTGERVRRSGQALGRSPERNGGKEGRKGAAKG